MDYSPWGCKESGTTEQLHSTHFERRRRLHIITSITKFPIMVNSISLQILISNKAEKELSEKIPFSILPPWLMENHTS